MRPTDGVPRSDKAYSLNNMAGVVLSVLKTKTGASFADIADGVMESIFRAEQKSKSDQRKITRRVYDILNVFTAAGLISKDKDRIQCEVSALPSFQRGPPDEMREIQLRISGKESAVVQKARLLIHYKILIERNRSSRRPKTIFLLPVLFVGFRDVGNGQVRRTLDGTTLEISAEAPPTFYSPMDIFDKMQFAVESQLYWVRRLSLIAPLELMMFPRTWPIQKEDRGRNVPSSRVGKQ
jgi:hypothetical protein